MKEWLEGDHRRGALIGSTGTFDSVTTYCNMEGPVGFIPNLLEAPASNQQVHKNLIIGHCPRMLYRPWRHIVLCSRPWPDCGVSALPHTGGVTA